MKDVGINLDVSLVLDKRNDVNLFNVYRYYSLELNFIVYLVNSAKSRGFGPTMLLHLYKFNFDYRTMHALVLIKPQFNYNYCLVGIGMSIQDSHK